MSDEQADRMFELGGAFEHADDIAEGIEERCIETMNASGRVSVGVMFNTMEIMWLVDAYRRLRDG